MGISSFGFSNPTEMKVLLIVALSVFCFSVSITNAQSLERQVIATAGSNMDNGFIIGEVLVSSGNLKVAAGFQQGILNQNTSLNVEDITQKLTVYPVPTKDILNIRGENFSAENTNVTLFSVEGRKVEVRVESGADYLRISLGSLPAGKYYLKLEDYLNSKIANYKILKIK